MSMRGHQNIRHTVHADIASNQVLTQSLETIQHEQFAGNQQVNTDLQRQFPAHIVRINEFQDTQKDFVRNFGQGDFVAHGQSFAMAHAVIIVVVASVVHGRRFAHASTQHNTKVFGSNRQNGTIGKDRLTLDQELDICQIRIVNQLGQILYQRGGREINGLEAKFVEIIHDAASIVSGKDPQMRFVDLQDQR